MSFTHLRRSRPALRRVSVTDSGLSPSTAPHLPHMHIAAAAAGPRIHATADFTEADDDEDDDDDDDEDDDDGGEDDDDDDTFPLHSGGGRNRSVGNQAGANYAPVIEEEEEQEEEEEEEEEDDGNKDEDAVEDDGDHDSSMRRPPLPVLPLFSSSHLDTLPVYPMTHAIRIIVSTRTETTLSWEQLRSPQVSQFLIKPMQQQIRAQHFSRATLYALMANCLQFAKEGQRYAANAGTSNTRAKVCELLALKMLKEYSTRELIDALAYDFYPLQGMPGGAQQPPESSTGGVIGIAVGVGGGGSRAKNTKVMASRTSTLEVAIRASAKHFLAHPVVVQQLEAIWSGAITFYASADSLHRENPSSRPPLGGLGNTGFPKADDRTPLLGSLAASSNQRQYAPPGRRIVMLYDPRRASLLKLSRLRVPRYRSFLSTLSLGVLIGLFLAVLTTRSVQITGLELFFWFWSAGFMLDELVGFNEQGFALYIMSFWNIFDLGILVLLIVYYCMRIYGVFLADPQHSNAMAYDVLAANAILLLPRIFSVLDHYQYFSQMLIAFRLMTADLAAVCVLILIVCSGFFVFFTTSQASGDASDIAYRIFQILMGFTPAAWELWPSYNWLARFLMAMFLIICHFLVVTILISVLTNSFKAITSNANEEHQFLFAINTISMVKNDALFSYVAPSNIFAWLLMPLRYCMPLKQFVALNRIIIKITHCPILFCIYLYERFWLAPSVYEPTDLVENHTRGRLRTISFADAAQRISMFTPSMRVREESVAGYQKDRALEELFLRLPDAATLRTQRRNERRKTQTAIRNWMDQNDADGVSGAGNWSTLGSRIGPEWQRRKSLGWDRRANPRRISDARSIVSDPADIVSNAGGAPFVFPPRTGMGMRVQPPSSPFKDHTDADGDDEFVTNDEEEEFGFGSNVGHDRQRGNTSASDADDYFVTPMDRISTRRTSSHASTSKVMSPTRAGGPAGRRDRELHGQTLSSSTILFNPEQSENSLVSPPRKQPAQSKRTNTSSGISGGETSAKGGRRGMYPHTPNSKPPARPTDPATQTLTSAGGVSRTALMSMDRRNRDGHKDLSEQLSPADLSLLSDNINSVVFDGDANAGMAGSFQTQMAMAMMKNNGLQNRGPNDSTDRDRMGRLVLARMKTLEESFADVVREMRELKNSSTVPTTRRNSYNEEFQAGSSLEVGGERWKNRKGVMTPKSTGTGTGTGAHRRPGSRRSMKEGKAGHQGTTVKNKGKGRFVDYTTEEDGGEEKGYLQRGTSM